MQSDRYITLFYYEVTLNLSLNLFYIQKLQCLLDLFLKMKFTNKCNVLSVYFNNTRCDIIEPEEKTNNSALSTACVSHLKQKHSQLGPVTTPNSHKHTQTL